MLLYMEKLKGKWGIDKGGGLERGGEFGNGFKCLEVFLMGYIRLSPKFMISQANKDEALIDKECVFVQPTIESQ